MTDNIANEKRGICADSALKCHGTAYIFEKRAARIRRKVIILSFLGIAGPASVGAIIGTYNLDFKNIQLLLLIAGTIAIIQLIFSIWSLVSGWDRNLSYYIESKAANYRLASQYDRLSKTTTLSQNDFEVEFQALDREADIRANLDNQYDITDKEKRMGMRYGLRQYQRSCAGCNQIPTTMKATDCGICGQF